MLFAAPSPEAVSDLIRRVRREKLSTSFSELDRVDVATVEQAYALIVVDLRRHWDEGLELCTKIRERRAPVYVIALAPTDDQIDVVIALEAGADAVITDSSRVEATVARIRAGLRRRSIEHDGGKAEEPEAVLRFSSLTIDVWAREAIRDGRRISLTEREFDVLHYLARHPGEAISRSELLETVWGTDPGVYSRTIDTHIRRLREKLGDDSSDPDLIETVWAVGYRFVADSAVLRQE